MADRITLLNKIYENYDEDSRLCKSRHGELEYFTTMKFIKLFLKKGDSVLEAGAGTGQYSVTLAKEGFDVTALELVPKNLEIMRKKALYVKNIKMEQGDALDLSRFADESFDMTLVAGPMYHLFCREDYEKAVEEALRVTKKGGILFFAFLSVHSILYCNFLQGNFDAGRRIYFDENFNVKHQTEQRFSGFELDEIEGLFENKSAEHVTTFAADGILELAEKACDFKMTDHDFRLYKEYHLANCEKRELLGSSSHVVYVCRKK